MPLHIIDRVLDDGSVVVRTENHTATIIETRHPLRVSVNGDHRYVIPLHDVVPLPRVSQP